MKISQSEPLPINKKLSGKTASKRCIYQDEGTSLDKDGVALPKFRPTYRPTSWPAFLALEFEGQELSAQSQQQDIAQGRVATRLTKRRHCGPLYVQKPFYPEGHDVAHVYLLHPPGGIVSGDTLSIELTLKNHAQVVATTPGAARFYRAREEEGDAGPQAQRVVNQLSASKGSCLEWLPCETIVFDGAQLELVTNISLDENSNFIGWEIICLGLPVSHAPFVNGTFRQRFAVSVKDQPMIIETLMFTAESPLRQASCGFQSKPVFGTFIAGPNFLMDIDEIIAQLREHMSKTEDKLSISVGAYNEFIVLRYLGAQANKAREYFTQAWEIVRPFILNKPAVAPRIWTT